MFLFTNISIEIVIKMPYLTLNNINIYFVDKDFNWGFYTIAKALSNINWVELIDEKKFAKAALNKNIEAFIMHVTFLSFSLLK